MDHSICKNRPSSDLVYLLAGYANKEIEFIMNANSFKVPAIIACPEDKIKEKASCYIRNATGSQSFQKYRFSLEKGLPVIDQTSGSVEFYPAGELPEKLWKK